MAGPISPAPDHAAGANAIVRQTMAAPPVTHRRTISGRPLGWRGHRCETDGISFRTLCGQDVPASVAVTLLCGDPEPICDACFAAIGGEVG